MPEIRKIIKVFLASPGDLGEERSAAKAVIDDINDDLSDALGYQTELVGWEDTLPGPGRPQEVINRDLDGCDLFVGMLWKRWGMHPGGSGQYTSGFEEEYCRSVARYNVDGQPYLTLLFKDIEPSAMADPGPQLKRVLEFRDQVFSERKLLAGTFADRATFEKKFRKCVVGYISRLQRAAQAGATQKEQAPLPESDEAAKHESSAPTSDTGFRSALAIQGTRFLRDFAATTEQLPDGTSLDATAVARLRLLGVIAGVSANDVATLNAHDANLLFRACDTFDYGRPELIGLLDVGLDQFRHENVPLWHWVLATTGASSSSYILQISTFVGPAPRRVNALLAMHLVGFEIVEETNISRADLIGFWLSDESTDGLKVAALNYLADYGHPSDLSLIQKEYQKNESQTTSAAVNTILRITSRNDRPRALELLQELQPVSIDGKLAVELFSNPSELSDAALSDFVKHRSPDVRKRAAKTLRERAKLDESQAEALLGDVDADVRYEGIQGLVDAGRTFSIDQAKKLLIKPVSRGLLSWGQAKDVTGEALFEMFSRELTKNLPKAQLETEADTEIFDQNAFFALVLKDYKNKKVELQDAIRDGFEKRYERLLSGVVARLGASETTEKIRALGKTLCKTYTRQALDIICRKQDKEDLPFVRSLLEGGLVGNSTVDFQYLGKHGQWRDIQIIVDSVRRPTEKASTLLLSSPDQEVLREAMLAVLKLGKHRIAELIAMPMPDNLLSLVVANTPDRLFSSLTDAQVKPLTFSNSDAVRKGAAQRYIRVFGQQRCKAFLQEYMSAPPFFYNVIYWLDLGTSCTRANVLKATSQPQ